MNEKKFYEVPEVEVSCFAVEDILTGSTEPTNGIILPDDEW